VSGFPLVTVVIPARDEAADIEGCLDAIAGQDYPINRLEVIVVEGGSTDGTLRIACQALGRYGFARAQVVHNAKGTTPSNLNVGLGWAAGEVLCRVDARTRIEPQYVRTCTQILTTRPEVAVVGGSQIAVPRDRSPRAVGIARALNNRYTMGGSRYRRATSSGPSDTVYLGAFRTEALRAVGGWDERLTTNQDFDLNRRMATRGMVWFEASLQSGYRPRQTYLALWKQYLRFGRGKVAYWGYSGDKPQVRQAAAAAFLPLMLVGAPAIVRRLGVARSVTLGMAGAAAVDLAGARKPKVVSPEALGCSLLATACISGAWSLGLYVELARSIAHRT
jgi:succinoglycan biosynthesis protein ExoA